jgi:hypothetical protein
MDMILYLLGLVVAFVWGYRFREHLATKKMDNLVQRLSQEMEEVKSNVMLVTIEKHGDMFLVYEKDTNRFLTQSTDQKELGENLKRMFPNKRFAASHQNMREVGYDESI